MFRPFKAFGLALRGDLGGRKWLGSWLSAFAQRPARDGGPYLAACLGLAAVIVSGAVGEKSNGRIE